MPSPKPTSAETAAILEAIRGIKPDQPARSREWLRTLAQALVTGIVGVVGAVVGARTLGGAQLQLEQQKDLYATQQQRIDKAEEIITIIEKSPQTYIETKRKMLLEPSHMFTPPDDAARVTALVTLYFPSAVDSVRAYEARCAEHIEMLSESGIKTARHEPLGDADQVTFYRVLNSGDIVISDVVTALGHQYKKRNPVTVTESGTPVR
jgi:hypothetical protein